MAYFWKALELILFLKLDKTQLILSAPLNILLRRLCPRPPDPNLFIGPNRGQNSVHGLPLKWAPTFLVTFLLLPNSRVHM